MSYFLIVVTYVMLAGSFALFVASSFIVSRVARKDATSHSASEIEKLKTRLQQFRHSNLAVASLTLLSTFAMGSYLPDDLYTLVIFFTIYYIPLIWLTVQIIRFMSKKWFNKEAPVKSWAKLAPDAIINAAVIIPFLVSLQSIVKYQ